MTENEAIEVLSNELIVIADIIGYCKDFEKESDLALAYRVKRKEAHIIAISALKEIHLYKDNKLCLIPEDVYSRQCSELDAYKEIGTVEECREAVEKQKPKKIIIRDWNPTECPTCGHELSTSLGDGYYKHPTFLKMCPNCGQMIRWSEDLEGMEK